MRIMNSVYPENKRDPYVTSLSLSCAVGTSVIVFPSVFSASPCALLCSRITLSLSISEDPKVDAGPSVVLTAGRHSRRLAVRGDAEAVGSRQPPLGLPCRRCAVEAAVCGQGCQTGVKPNGYTERTWKIVRR